MEYRVSVNLGAKSKRGFIHSQLGFIDYVLSALEECGLDFHRNFKIEFQQGCGRNNWYAYIDGDQVASYVDNVLKISPYVVTGGTWDKIVNHPVFSVLEG